VHANLRTTLRSTPTIDPDISNDNLESLGELQDTNVFYFDDHGVESGKGSLYEGGIRSVSFVWSPRHVKEMATDKSPHFQC
jgi:arylsulfatase A-like enzyme